MSVLVSSLLAPLVPACQVTIHHTIRYIYRFTFPCNRANILYSNIINHKIYTHIYIHFKNNLVTFLKKNKFVKMLNKSWWPSLVVDIASIQFLHFLFSSTYVDCAEPCFCRWERDQSFYNMYTSYQGELVQMDQINTRGNNSSCLK